MIDKLSRIRAVTHAFLVRLSSSSLGGRPTLPGCHPARCAAVVRHGGAVITLGLPVPAEVAALTQLGIELL